jgi:hypothetical protein
MLIKIKNQIIELLEEEPAAQSGHGLMIALGILIFSLGACAAMLAAIF